MIPYYVTLDHVTLNYVVIPAHAGSHLPQQEMGSRFRGNDEKGGMVPA